jgi:23S rRNA (uracil1939-C5)-methyltransferase
MATRPAAPAALLELAIEDLAFGGRGVARHEGRVVLVEGGFPGDTVEARVFKRRRSLWEAKAERVVSASPDRVPARCAHVGICGGCKLQEYAYERQLAAKVHQVEEALRRLGKVADPPMRPAVPAAEPFAYRNKMEFSYAVDRDSGELICGLHYAGRFDRVFELTECHLVPDTFARTVEASRAFLRARRVPAYDQRGHTGYARFLVVRRSVASGELLVNFVTAEGDYGLREGFVAAVREAVPEVTGIVHTINDRRAQIAVGEIQDVWHGRGALTERLGELEFDISPQSFFQTNSRQAAMLYDLVVQAAAVGPDDTVLDLYAGTGTIGLYLAQRAGSVIAVEQVEEAVGAARTNAHRNGIAHVQFVTADVLAWLKAAAAAGAALARPLVVVLDPPRAGLHPDVPPHVTALGARRIVYVSCNPAALARDVELFAAGGFALAQVTPIDMFPHTAHVECVAVFVPR